MRQWAEVDFVPGEPGEKKDRQPLRYVGLRLLKPQGALFADGTDRHHHAVITNLEWDGAKLLQWHRAKAGTVEHVHDEVKNETGGGHLPSQHFAVNAAWFKLALLTYNLASAIKGLCFAPEERTARFKKYRLLLVHLAGRMSRFRCKLRLRFCARPEAIARVQKVWAVFALPTQATAFTSGDTRKGARKNLIILSTSPSPPRRFPDIPLPSSRGVPLTSSSPKRSAFSAGSRSWVHIILAESNAPAKLLAENCANVTAAVLTCGFGPVSSHSCAPIFCYTILQS